MSKKTTNLNSRVFLAAAILVCLSACARAPVRPPEPAGTVMPGIAVQPPAALPRQDMFHVVAPSETLWRIGKIYDVEVNAIMRANDLSDPKDLKIGQRLFIPQAAPAKRIVPLYPSKKWRYIIIHHSATDQGNAISLFNMHKKRGFTTLGYHFIIDNGTCDKKEGGIEAAPRWIKQSKGAHCKAARMNYKGIGICLVGNFSKTRVSEKQLDTLVYLVDILREYYRIPEGNILGHGQVPGARTECPGKYFPWSEFKRRVTVGR